MGASPFKKVLILTASGGNGGLSASEAIAQNITSGKVQITDLMNINLISKWGVKLFNYLLSTGRFDYIIKLTKLKTYGEYILWPHAFIFVLFSLLIKKFDHVIDNQPVVTSAIIKAIRIYNRLKKKNIILEKVIVDMPTHACQHYFRNIKTLSPKDRKNIFLISLKPLLKPRETEEQFWKTNCNLSLDRISYNNFPIRKSFKYYSNKSLKDKSLTLKLCQSPSETLLASKICSRLKNCKEGFQFTISPKDKIITVLLGSQAAIDATFEYTKQFVSLSKILPKETIYALFVYCSISKNDLFSKIYLSFTKIAPNICIIPFTFQREDIIAKLFSRSNVLITKSGGQTTIELMTVVKGHSFIHSEEKETLSQEKLQEGMSSWETGNALYAKQKLKSKFITPSLFQEFCKPLLT